jgi:transmembrane sensor
VNDHSHIPDREGIEAGALDWARHRAIADEVIRRTAIRVRRRRNRLASFSAVAGVAALVTFIGWNRLNPDEGNLLAGAGPHHGLVSISKVTQRVLPDGSIVELNGGAQIELDFSTDQRRIAMTRGEAHFEVAHDAARPFIVTANGVEVRAIGTAFLVEIGQQRVEVCVTEGKVSVASPVSESGEPVANTLLDAGKRAVVAVNGPGAGVGAPDVSGVDEKELHERQSWRVPRLEFVGTPLADAVATFNEHAARWTDTRLELGDPNLSQLRLSGIIRADNTEILLRVLATEFGISAERRDDVIVLRKR